MKRALTLIILATGAFTACYKGDSSDKPKTPNGTVGDIVIPAARYHGSVDIDLQDSLKVQGFLGDASVQFTRVVSNGAIDTATERHIWATYEFINKTNQAFENLTFYAYNQSANNIGGTALKNVKNVSDVLITDPDIVRQMRPTHHLTISNGSFQVDNSQAGFQAVLNCESGDVEQAARAANAIANTDSVLSYAFVSQNVTGGRSILPNALGTVTIAYVVPLQTNMSNTPRKVTVTLQVVDEPTALTRVTRAVEESTANVLARAGAPINATNVAFIGSTEEAPPPLKTLRFSQINTYAPSIQEMIPEQKFQKYVDAGVSRSDRCVLTGIASQFSEAEWNAGISISDGTTGRVIVNRLGNPNPPSVRSLQYLRGNVYIDPVTGEEVLEPPKFNDLIQPTGGTNPKVIPQNNPPQCTGSEFSGPFRRIETPRGTDTANPPVTNRLQQYGYASATVGLSDGTFSGQTGTLTTNASANTKEAAFVYFGFTSKKNISSDIGLSLSVQSRKWIPFYRPYSGQSVYKTYPTRIYNADSNTTIEISTVQNASGQYGDTNLYGDGSALQLFVNGKTIDFWQIPGLDNDARQTKIRKVTSLAQADATSKQFVTRTNTGAFVSISWLASSLGLRRAPNPTGLRDWYLTSDIATDCANPSAKIFTFSLGDRSKEEVTIDLRQ